jgi:hypothetical protein
MQAYKLLKSISARAAVLVLYFFVATLETSVHAGTLSCSVTTQAGCTGTVMLRMSSSTNAQVELPAGANFTNNVVCCTGVTGLGTTCSGTFAVIAKLSSTTNAHIEQNNQSNYPHNTCISVASGNVQVAYQNSSCTGFDTTLFSMSSTTNAHAGTAGAYTIKACGSADNVVVQQSITFSISSVSSSFGNLSQAVSSYASSTGPGSGVEVTAHTMTASSSGGAGYTIYVQGGTLQSLQNSADTITAIGGVNTTPAPGTEQFGLRLATTSGNGLVTTPYNGAGFAYAATATTSSSVATGASDGVTTVYSVRYLANVGALTEAGSYSASLVYVAVANF